jgi:ABC-type polysaccharide/polyol phosphate export permease
MNHEKAVHVSSIVSGGLAGSQMLLIVIKWLGLFGMGNISWAMVFSPIIILLILIVGSIAFALAGIVSMVNDIMLIISDILYRTDATKKCLHIKDERNTDGK